MPNRANIPKIFCRSQQHLHYMGFCPVSHGTQRMRRQGDGISQEDEANPTHNEQMSKTSLTIVTSSAQQAQMSPGNKQNVLLQRKKPRPTNQTLRNIFNSSSEEKASEKDNTQ